MALLIEMVDYFFSIVCVHVELECIQECIDFGEVLRLRKDNENGIK